MCRELTHTTHTHTHKLYTEKKRQTYKSTYYENNIIKCLLNTMFCILYIHLYYMQLVEL